MLHCAWLLDNKLYLGQGACSAGGFLSDLQGQHVTKALGTGRTFNGALVFIAMEDCGEPLQAAESPCKQQS